MSISCLENINEYVFNQGHGVKGLADIGIKSLPNQFIQPDKDKLFNRDKITGSDQDLLIPVIDMSNPNDPMVERQICDAAEKWGFLQIINHGVPLKVLDDIKDATHRFFELPVEEKSKYLEKNSPTKNVKYGTSYVPEFEKVFEWKDYLSLFCVSEVAARTHWPPSCRNEALEYMKSAEAVIRNLIKILMKGLNIDEKKESHLKAMTNSMKMDLIYYPKCPNSELTFGVVPHSDVSTFSMLLQDDTGGLYFRRLDDNESWVHALPINGALVINIGDMLQILSNGKYKSAEHLVIPNGRKTRVSIPIFIYPNSDSIVCPLEGIIDRGDKPIYKHVIYSDYINHYYSNPHDGKARIEYAMI